MYVYILVDGGGGGPPAGGGGGAPPGAILQARILQLELDVRKAVDWQLHVDSDWPQQLSWDPLFESVVAPNPLLLKEMFIY